MNKATYTDHTTGTTTTLDLNGDYAGNVARAAAKAHADRIGAHVSGLLTNEIKIVFGETALEQLTNAPVATYRIVK